MSHSLARKYPNAHKELRWQYLFPMKKVSTDPEGESYAGIMFWR
jgi:hypothetical protein